MPELSDVLLLCLAAAFAGWMDAVSGGGGLVQLPALLLMFPGATPAQLLATNKIASFCGTSMAGLTYFRKLRPDLRTAIPMAMVALAGGALGALCASLLSREVFRPFVLFLLVCVAIYTAVRPRLGDVQALRWSGRRHHVTAGFGGFAIGFYDGIFGPGTGSFLVILLVAVLGYSFLQAAAHARIVNLATNLGALMVFIPQGAPMWRIGLVMGLCNIAGAWLGAHTAIRRGSGFVRIVFLVVVGALVLRLGYDVVRDLLGRE